MPKCLLAAGGQTILDHQLDGLFRAGVTDLAIVVGYNQEQIIRHLKRNHPGKLHRIEFIFNPNFAFTNNAYSLWLARHWAGDDGFLCLNADVLCHPDILMPAVRTHTDISVVIDREFREETTKVIIRGDRVMRLSKSITRENYSGTFVGIATFSAKAARLFFKKAQSFFAERRVNAFFNDVLSELIPDGVTVRFTETDGLPWAEVDDADDWRFAQVHVIPELEPEALLNSR